ncbi:hypothetical protein [Peribacillus kribbensis]|uniref:hypothetical protein n=1 Tax=Peribacillus kribbensis TaxID=356658 RepID=UPI00047AE13C|nr:hypothetical protein [Peribacillus kribbensis]
MNLGNNLPSGFVNYKKHSQGFGSIHGDHNDIHEILATIKEKDIQDTFHYDALQNESDEQILNKLADEMLNTELEIEEEDEDLS